MTIFICFVLIIIFVILFYIWTTTRINEFKERGVPHDKPWPIFGNIGSDILLGRASIIKLFIKLHEKYKHCKVYGFYNMWYPVIFISSAELVRKIFIDDFQNFNEHRVPFEVTDTDFGRNLYSLKETNWAEMRKILAATFTVEKMRHTYELIDECCMEGIVYLEEQISKIGEKGLEFRMDDIFARFANDIIASAALGIKVISFRQKENCFFRIGTTVFNMRGALYMIKAILIEMLPKLMKFFGFKVFDAQVLKNFNRLVATTIKYRAQHNIKRADMINLLLDAKNDQALLHQITDEDIVAQCLLCYCAGFGKVSPSLCFIAHELMENPNVQERLYQEILATKMKLNGKPLNYDILTNMKYMDMVISEALRKWPAFAITDRICKQDYDLKDVDGNLILKLRKNDDIWISIIGLHWDSENFKDPEKFQPERFSEENRKNIKPYAYLPFGVGPRNCLGIHLAHIEMKAIMFHILLKFQITCGEKTAVNLFDSIQGFYQTPESFWLRLVPRKSKV